jgi:hypothetical protein
MTAMPGVNLATLQRLGRVSSDKLSSFVNFPLKKPSGVIRIGTFGDSFTHGDEVDASSDYPDQLANLLRQAGLKVEVLNFGNGWYGFGQSFILWDEVGRNYDLDYILLGPQTFFPRRDTRFNHSEDASPYYLHSRFVLEGNNLRRIDVIGDTYQDRLDNYYNFFTPWRYVRYDRSDPAFLAAALPAGRELDNPFYYDRRSEQDEATLIYLDLVGDMVKSGPPIAIGLYPAFEHLQRAMAGLAGDRFCVTTFEQPPTFPYLAPLGHNSPTGNRFLAYQYLSVLRGQPIEAPTLSTTDIPFPKAPTWTGPTELSAFDQVQVELNGVDAGRFVAAVSAPVPVATSNKPEGLSFLKDRKVHSLVAVKARDRSILDAVFVAFPNDVDLSAPARLIWRSGNAVKEVTLGPVRRVAQPLSFGVIDVPSLSNRWRDPMVLPSAALSQLVGRPRGAGSVQLVIGSTTIVQGTTAGNGADVSLHSESGKFYFLRAAPTGDASVDRGQRSGVAELVLAAGGKVARLPVAQWQIDERRLDPSAPCTKGWKPLFTSAADK